jgi:serine/threonine-protein kinase
MILLVTAVTGSTVPLWQRIFSFAVVLAAGGLVVWATRQKGLSPDRLLELGSVFAIVIALTLAFFTVPMNWFASRRAGILWSPVAVWVLVFPLIVPGSRRRTLVVALLASSSEPLVVLLHAHLAGLPVPGARQFFLNGWPNLMAVVLSGLVSSTIYRLGEKLARARAMGSYQLLRPLGRGGMGEVWLARHRLLARDAALKVIQPGALGDASPAEATDMFRRFEREARATAALRSPHTIELYDFGVARDGTFYYVMELLDGIDLERLVERHGPPPPERVVFILRQACHSLHEAHVRGLVHRDIKPANIFLCRHGTDLDFVKVLDFGLVRERTREDQAEARQAADGKLSGTAAFLPPEMLLGSGGVDGRADLYALGCVAFWLLTGRLVFEKTNTFELAVAHATAQPPDIRAVAGRPIPEGLAALVMRCLAKDPGSRPSTVRKLSDLLAELELEGLWTEERRQEWWGTYGPRRLEAGAAQAIGKP